MSLLKTGLVAEIGSRERAVRLLPAFDAYLLGYQNRDFAVPPAYQDRVFHGGQLVLVDGCAAGTSFSPEVHDLIGEEADDIGRFLGLTVALSLPAAGQQA